MTRVYGRYSYYILLWFNKPTNITGGAPPCGKRPDSYPCRDGRDGSQQGATPGPSGQHGDVKQHVLGEWRVVNPPWAGRFTLWLWLTVCYWKLTIEIVDFPINSMVIFHSYVNIYRRFMVLGEPHWFPTFFWAELSIAKTKLELGRKTRPSERANGDAAAWCVGKNTGKAEINHRNINGSWWLMMVNDG